MSADGEGGGMEGLIPGKHNRHSAAIPRSVNHSVYHRGRDLRLRSVSRFFEAKQNPLL